MSFSSFWAKNKALIFLVVIIGVCVYINALGNSFVWDDEEMVFNNFPFFTLSNLPRLFTQATFYTGGGALSGWFYRPLVMVAFLLIKVILGTSPFGFHLVQIVLHVINSILIFWIFSFLFEKRGRKEISLVAFLLAGVFAVHPGFVEAVSYIASIAEPLYTLCLLVFFVFVLRSQEKELTNKEKIFAFIFLLLAFLTKEGALVFLPITFLYVFLFQRKNLVTWLWMLFGGFMTYIFVRFAFFGIQMQTPQFLAPLARAPISSKLLTIPYIIFAFFRTFFVPVNLSVSQHEVVREINWANFGIPILVILLFVLMAVIFLVKKKSKLGFFFIAWFVLGVSPLTSVIFPLDMTFAERWLYFPAIGLLGFLGTLVVRIPNLRKFMPVFLVFGSLVIVLLGVRTIVRNSNWKDGFTLYSHDIVLEPESFDLQNNLGVELTRRGEWEEALVHIQKSVDLEPKWEISTNNLGAMYEHTGDFPRAEEYYKKSITLGDYYLAYENYTIILIKEKKFKEVKEFLEGSALAKFPNNQRLMQAYSYVQGQKF